MGLKMIDASYYVPFARQLASAAGAVIHRYFRAPLTVEQKADDSPVTIADREAESAMRLLIMQHYPEHGIFGEEGARHLPHAEYQWVLDPIDGTRAFIAGYPTFTTLIALCHHGVPILGLIHQPIMEETWEAACGSPPSLPEMDEAYLFPASNSGLALATTSTDYFTPDEALAFSRVREACGQVVLGGDAYAYAMLASGYIDVVIDAGLKPYDFCALVPVVESVGGKITDWNGAPLHLNSGGQVIAARNAATHTTLRNLL